MLRAILFISFGMLLLHYGLRMKKGSTVWYVITNADGTETQYKGEVLGTSYSTSLLRDSHATRGRWNVRVGDATYLFNKRSLKQVGNPQGRIKRFPNLF